MFADVFVGKSETPEGLQKQIEKAVEYARKRIVTAILVCNEDKKNPASNSTLRVEVGMCSHKTNREMRKLKLQYRAKNMQRKR